MKNINSFLNKKHEIYLRGLGLDQKERSQFKFGFIFLALSFLVFFVWLGYMMVPARGFSEEAFTIESGSSLTTIASLLKEKDLIKSKDLFRLSTKIQGKASGLKAGDYRFEDPLSTWAVARRIGEGSYGDVLEKLTIPEGSTNEDIAKIASRLLPNFRESVFLKEAAAWHGYLFPETYLVPPSMTEKGLIELMHTEFSKKLLSIAPNKLVTLEKEDLRNIVIMASIIEREAYGERDSYIIAGILWKRIDIGMPLQVDASFSYLLNKTSAELTLNDLKTDSPYNTYTNTGLPPGPISNPGAIALDAALHPADSPYLYFLHDINGGTHYGKNFEEHKQNKRLYLN